MQRALSAFLLVCLGLFFVTVTARSVRLWRQGGRAPLRFGLRGRLTWSTASFVTTALWAILVMLAAIRGLSGDERALPGGRLVLGVWTQVVGMAAVAAGFWLLWLGMRELGNAWRLGIDEANGGRLVTSGVYARTRNPIYLFFGLYFLGTALASGHVILWALWLLNSAALHGQVLQEERFLQARFGEAYRRYCETTPRSLVGWSSFLGVTRRLWR